MPADRDVVRLKQSIASFGFTVVIRGPRVFALWQDEKRVFIARKLGRVGFWELNETNKDMWETFGAQGFTVFQHIAVHELVKWMYDHATECINKYGVPKSTKKKSTTTRRKEAPSLAKASEAKKTLKRKTS